MTIKEVEQYLEVPRATVRFYEKEGLIRPERGGNGYRDYSDEDVERLRKIIIFRKLGMALTDIEDVLDGAKPLSEAVAENITNLEKQIEELKGALLVCRRLQEEQEEIETFEADKYWNVIEEEEKRGNRFLDIAKDMVHYEKGILLEFFNIADCEGNLSVGIGQMFLNVLACLIVYVIVRCLLYQDWSLQSVLDGVWGLVFILVLELLVGIPVFLVGRKRPEVLQKRNKIMFWSFTALFVLCILLIALSRRFGW